MQTINLIQHQLGIMTYPFIVMSFIALLIICERIIFLMLNSRTNSKAFLNALYKTSVGNCDSLNDLINQLKSSKKVFNQGALLLLNHRNLAKSLREEMVSVWLQKKSRQYNSGLRILTIIGVISPLIGLLGTVLGLMEMFADLANTKQAIEPSVLADGLGLAMSTTAAGLILALPAIFAAQLFNLWAEHRIAHIEHSLNLCNLYLEGITPDQETGINTKVSAKFHEAQAA